ncbi:Vacuolar morphogenesis protein 7 [Lachancea thermotolerans]|uniref:KLTH0G01672p n=1 Tax=Lachancea thermotolerans (strain ATCC 56472 / CBS 6340 / NRRL Y-8284) TaxID=559295 RepID=C5DLL6_LACTC|nr:KLTH0G01672p [Lachancea thermotolerans CBS 6340]CAR24677.1 KLTH0G01672p [Lachancea thermotolerans CBS 6340]
MLGDKSVHVEVHVSKGQIVKKSYTLYLINLKITKDGGLESSFHSLRRFSEFVQLKKDLEQEVGCELPYELPPRRFIGWLRPASSCDPDVIEERVRELTTFLQDLLNDSFDTRWRKARSLCQFLRIPDDWDNSGADGKHGNRSRDFHSSKDPQEEDLADAQKWLEELRNCKILYEEAIQNTSSFAKASVQLRLRIHNLEKGLKKIEAGQLVGAAEVNRRQTLLNGLKTDLNRSSLTWAPQSTETFDSGLLPTTNSQALKPIAGRKLGETNQTTRLNNQELLQLHKDTTQEQDKELEQLRRIILSQKDLSLTMNQELAQQNELLDYMGNEVDSTASKLRLANRKAKKFNGN